MQVEHLIIGFGKAGKTLAASLAKAGKSVALVEKSADMYGGTCINIGCIPTKSLLFLSNHSDWQSAQAKTRALTEALNAANYQKLAALCPIYTGTASFVDAHTVQVQGKDNLTIHANHIYINTGAISTRPPIKNTSTRTHDSTSIMRLNTLPKRLTIIGAGFIGLEFAFMFAGFGAKVRVLEGFDVFLPNEPRVIADAIFDIAKNKGIDILLGTKTDEIYDDDDGVIASTNQGKLVADALLFATGRRANTDGLLLDNAGVLLDEKGFIKVNERLQTSAPHIYAMGDVAGSPQFTYISLDDYRVVKSQILGDGTRTTVRSYPYAAFIQPPLASTGLSFEQAQKKGIDARLLTLPTQAIPMAKILGQTDGVLSAVVASDGKILGAKLLCPQAHEMINLIDLAIKQGLYAKDLANHIFTHPTMSESLNDLFAQY